MWLGGEVGGCWRLPNIGIIDSITVQEEQGLRNFSVTDSSVHQQVDKLFGGSLDMAQRVAAAAAAAAVMKVDVVNVAGDVAVDVVDDRADAVGFDVDIGANVDVDVDVDMGGFGSDSGVGTAFACVNCLGGVLVARLFISGSSLVDFAGGVTNVVVAGVEDVVVAIGGAGVGAAAGVVLRAASEPVIACHAPVGQQP
ncbi:hypothetical protein E0Z10_g44 [Xylaria hypoxylon]|uniref:Uncharacterized protein n=1 Tax=Xylaria hypoxylon TaxID=37992 RepID=A0A4Z0Z915_9PEZI|nr:hypothetical protein E0Z10_g44 [Xylaria hypoxylon]